MKKEVFILLVLAGIVSFQLTINACDHKDGPKKRAEMQQKRLNHMTKDLVLTEPQVQQVQTIFKEQDAKMKAAHDEFESKLKTVLNEEQRKKFEARQLTRHDG